MPVHKQVYLYKFIKRDEWDSVDQLIASFSNNDLKSWYSILQAVTLRLSCDCHKVCKAGVWSFLYLCKNSHLSSISLCVHSKSYPINLFYCFFRDFFSLKLGADIIFFSLHMTIKFRLHRNSDDLVLSWMLYRFPEKRILISQLLWSSITRSF